MSNDSKAEAFLLEAVRHFNKIRSDTTLGDRGSYIGASDIASAFGCERRVLLNKLNPSTPDNPFVLERGHWIEDGIGLAINSRMRHALFGLAIAGETLDGTPILVHPDIVCICSTKILVFEIKSVSRIPDQVRTEHQSQLYIQLGMMAGSWDKPVFALRQDREHPVSFPALVKERFGLGLPKRPPIEGYIVYASFDGLKCSAPFSPHPAIFDIMLKKADRLWALRATPEQAQCARGIYPLCDYCSHNADCPNFQSTVVPELADVVRRYLDAKAIAKAAEESEARIAAELKAFASAPEFLNKWLSTGGPDRIKVSRIPGRSSVDNDRLCELLVQEHGFTENRVDSLIEAATSQGGPHLRLTHNRAKDKKEATLEKAAA
jgi:hypothetical protein